MAREKQRQGKKTDTTILKENRGLDRTLQEGEVLGSRTTMLTRVETTGGLMILI